MHTSRTPEDWFTPVDELPAILRMVLGLPAIVVDPDTGAGAMLVPQSVTLGEDGEPVITRMMVQEYAPGGRRVDRFERFQFPCSCGHCPNTVIDLGVN